MLGRSRSYFVMQARGLANTCSHVHTQQQCVKIGYLRGASAVTFEAHIHIRCRKIEEQKKLCTTGTLRVI